MHKKLFLIIVVISSTLVNFGCAGFIKQIPEIKEKNLSVKPLFSNLVLDYQQMKYMHMDKYQKNAFLNYYTTLGKKHLIEKGLLDTTSNLDTLNIKIVENSYYRTAGIKTKSMIPFVLVAGFSLTLIPASIHLDITGEANYSANNNTYTSTAKETILYFFPMMFMIGTNAPYMIRDKIFEAMIKEISDKIIENKEDKTAPQE